MKRDRERLARTEGALSRVKSRTAMANKWRSMARSVYSPRVCGGMPPFVERLAQSFWDVDPMHPVKAITAGDPAFFVSFQVRLDQIDCALVEAGRSIASRAPVVRAKYLLDGFQRTAAKVLEENGGEWPPRDPRAQESP